MNQDTRSALYAFLAHLTTAQTVALMDVLSSHVENVETDMEVNERPPEFAFTKAVAEYVAQQTFNVE